MNDLIERAQSAPYPGLRPFRREEARIFFGREEHIEEMLARLEGNRFLVVVGASGSGKSSLVRAGLLPAIDRGFLVGPTHMRIATMRPRGAPIAQLSAALAKPGVLGADDGAVGHPQAFLEASLRRGARGLCEAVEEKLFDTTDTGLLLVVDQFEEIFRYRHEQLDAAAAEEAETFVQLLLAAVEDGTSQARKSSIPIYVVLTMRSDYIGDCAAFRGLPQAINDSQFLTPVLTRDQYRDAIARPASAAHQPLEEALITRLLNEMSRRNDDDQLPVLQHALMRMWQRARGQASISSELFLSLKRKGAGGSPLDDALSEHCDEVLGKLDAEDARIAQVVFCMLCEGGTGKRDRRRPASAEQVRKVASCSLERLQRVVDAFRGEGRCFLLPPDGDLTPDTILDISHESLIRNWRTLASLLEQETDSADNYRRLLAAAERREKRKESLWRGPTLEYALLWRKERQPTAAWAERYGGRFELATRFLDDSRRSRSWTWSAMLFGTLVSVTAVVAAGLIGSGVVQRQIEQNAEVQKLQSEKLKLVKDKNKLEQQEQALERKIGAAERAAEALKSNANEMKVRGDRARLERDAAEREREIALAARSSAEQAKVAAEKQRLAADRAKHEAERAQRAAVSEAKVVRQRLLGIPSIDELEPAATAPREEGRP